MRFQIVGRDRRGLEAAGRMGARSMQKIIRLPQVELNLENATVVEIPVSVGACLKDADILMAIETQKATERKRRGFWRLCSGRSMGNKSILACPRFTVNHRGMEFRRPLGVGRPLVEDSAVRQSGRGEHQYIWIARERVSYPHGETGWNGFSNRMKKIDLPL